jgi:hypothetical protein
MSKPDPIVWLLDIPRVTQRTLIKWRLGEICRHRLCQIHPQIRVSRLHGIECAGIRNRIPEELYTEYPGHTVIDKVLNAVSHKRDDPDNHILIQIVFDAIQHLQIHCLGYIRQTGNLTLLPNPAIRQAILYQQRQRQASNASRRRNNYYRQSDQLRQLRDGAQTNDHG